MTDINGNFTYSNVVLLKVALAGFNVINVYPSPFVNKVNVDIASENNVPVSIKIIDFSGKSLVSRAYNINQGSSSIAITGLEGLSKGLYIMQVQCGGKTITQKILKQ